jgi:hypothetical protein
MCCCFYSVYYSSSHHTSLSLLLLPFVFSPRMSALKRSLNLTRITGAQGCHPLGFPYIFLFFVSLVRFFFLLHNSLGPFPQHTYSSVGIGVGL